MADKIRIGIIGAGGIFGVGIFRDWQKLTTPKSWQYATAV